MSKLSQARSLLQASMRELTKYETTHDETYRAGVDAVGKMKRLEHLLPQQHRDITKVDDFETLETLATVTGYGCVYNTTYTTYHSSVFFHHHIIIIVYRGGCYGSKCR